MQQQLKAPCLDIAMKLRYDPIRKKVVINTTTTSSAGKPLYDILEITEDEIKEKRYVVTTLVLLPYVLELIYAKVETLDEFIKEVKELKS